MNQQNPARRADAFSLSSAVRNPLARTVLKAVGKPLGKVLALDAISNRFQTIPQGAVGVDFLRGLMSAFGFTCSVSAEDLAHIPADGPVVMAANHPFGGMEGLLLADMLLKVRPDVKIMANYLLGRIEELRELFILVDPFGTGKSQARNIAPMRDSISWLRGGGCLGVFPAGEVAHFSMSERRVAEPRWSPSIARIIKSCEATVVPVHFSGANGAMFHLAGMVHPRLRTMLLGREFVNKAEKDVQVRIGQPILHAKIADMNDTRAAEYLRLRTEVLGGGEKKPVFKRFPVRSIVRQEALIAPQDPDLMAAEIERLPEERKLLTNGEQVVYEAKAHEIPLVLKEIGRLRETTFRKVGEGTGKSCDLDSFDAHYSHVFIWNARAREVVGAYRLGRTDEILAAKGRQGLYISTLFKLKPGFMHLLGPSLEMGRSFVRPEYQKSYNALLLLWRGIGTVVAREPKYRTLFGPVSITNEYQAASRQLIAGYFESRPQMPDLSRLVKPRTPMRAKSWLKKAAKALVADVESLSELVSSMEKDRKGIPVLLRQYLKLGGKLLAFNVDRDFSDALDGLIVVDLLETDRKQLERYLGKDGLAGFLEYQLGGFKRSA
ncbi:lysophospholipid acyltransferase family protein [Fundidesulfovibrio putealis]|uniref:lysophospholipid acyltransferase family protein n=1 Tax=Fundidesulfovibrio putealis TaxID=270496 RepID=UPI0003FB9DAF|nr:GNAT family N-acyltransferase [Fundidesulfovibrio putealis]